MVRHHLLHIQRILFHSHKVLDITEHALNNAIVVRRAFELGSDKLLHQFARFGSVVRLFLALVEEGMSLKFFGCPLTIDHLTKPYFTMSSFTNGPWISLMCLWYSSSLNPSLRYAQTVQQSRCWGFEDMMNLADSG